jgi:hypothetical protein
MLPVVCRLLERLVARQLITFLDRCQILPMTQSGVICCHSFETTAPCILFDVLQAVGRGDTAAQTLLDLSSAFDTVDHQILPERLRFNQSIRKLLWYCCLNIQRL